MNNKDLKKKLESELAESSWELLKPHQKREAIIVVAGDLDLIDAGIAVALDDSTNISKWMEKGLLHRPSTEQMNEWEKYNLEFDFLILSPFVLIQEPADSHYIVAVHQQMESETPPEVKKTYDRLISDGISEKETLQLISSILAFEIYNMKQEKREFNIEEYTLMLKQLPEKPF